MVILLEVQVAVPMVDGPDAEHVLPVPPFCKLNVSARLVTVGYSV